LLPAATLLNVSTGGSDGLPMLPQQASVPSVLTPHAWFSPAETPANVPEGASEYRLLPQQASVSSVLTAQV
jgi:hypothetical protein